MVMVREGVDGLMIVCRDRSIRDRIELIWG
jgi:hypothetical protein